jgi:hypothetical protein
MRVTDGERISFGGGNRSSQIRKQRAEGQITKTAAATLQ